MVQVGEKMGRLNQANPERRIMDLLSFPQFDNDMGTLYAEVKDRTPISLTLIGLKKLKILKK